MQVKLGSSKHQSKIHILEHHTTIKDWKKTKATSTYLLIDSGKDGERQSMLLTSPSTWLAYYESISIFGELGQEIGRKWVQLHHYHPHRLSYHLNLLVIG